MIDDVFRHQVWAQLEPNLRQTPAIDDYLGEVADLAGGTIGFDGSSSFCTSLYGSLITIGSSDRRAWEADQVEFDTADGPCVDALRTGIAIVVPDLVSERRWPAWSTVATLLGFSSAAGIPAELSTGQRIALNLYARKPDAFDDEALRRATLFVEEVARTVPTALRLVQADERTSQLEQALASRSTIDQALGVLMAQDRCSRDEAFGVLRRASQHRNIKLRDVAAGIIERFTGHAAAEPPEFVPGALGSRPAPPPDRPRSA